MYVSSFISSTGELTCSRPQPKKRKLQAQLKSKLPIINSDELAELSVSGLITTTMKLTVARPAPKRRKPRGQPKSKHFVDDSDEGEDS